MRVVVTCRDNRKGFGYEQLMLDQNMIEESSKDWLIRFFAWL